MTDTDIDLEKLRRILDLNKPPSSMAAYASVVVLCFVWTPLAAIFNGWVMCKCWAWFLASTFGAIPLAAFVGAGFIIALLRSRADSPATKSDKKKSAGELAGEAFGNGFVGPAVVLGFAWIVHHLI